MNILLIHGQNHKGSTYHIGRLLAETLGNSGDISEVFLPRDMSEFCCGCTKCFMQDEKLCPHYKYMKPITDLMDNADLLIFTTPVYVYHATGSMKAFLDHLGYRWMVHRPEEKMFSKRAVCISTAAGAGMKSACRDIKDSMFFWGVAKTYCYGVAVHASAWGSIKDAKKAAIENSVDALAKKIKGGKPSVSIKTKSFFLMMRLFQKKGNWNPADTEYWKEKGWDKKNRPWKTG